MTPPFYLQTLLCLCLSRSELPRKKEWKIFNMEDTTREKTIYIKHKK